MFKPTICIRVLKGVCTPGNKEIPIDEMLWCYLEQIFTFCWWLTRIVSWLCIVLCQTSLIENWMAYFTISYTLVFVFYGVKGDLWKPFALWVNKYHVKRWPWTRKIVQILHIYFNLIKQKFVTYLIHLYYKYPSSACPLSFSYLT